MLVNLRTLGELCRYPFYTLNEFNASPKILQWLRYSAFLVLYPCGLVSECKYLSTTTTTTTTRLQVITLVYYFGYLDGGLFSIILLLLIWWLLSSNAINPRSLYFRWTCSPVLIHFLSILSSCLPLIPSSRGVQFVALCCRKETPQLRYSWIEYGIQLLLLPRVVCYSLPCGWVVFAYGWSLDSFASFFLLIFLIYLNYLLYFHLFLSVW